LAADAGITIKSDAKNATPTVRKNPRRISILNPLKKAFIVFPGILCELGVFLA
jgi:hypothetical protein